MASFIVPLPSASKFRRRTLRLQYPASIPHRRPEAHLSGSIARGFPIHVEAGWLTCGHSRERIRAPERRARARVLSEATVPRQGGYGQRLHADSVTDLPIDARAVPRS